jgi:hypothetical protein
MFVNYTLMFVPDEVVRTGVTLSDDGLALGVVAETMAVALATTTPT